MKQIDEWTNKKIGQVIFDSDVDDWNQNSSMFDTKILNKQNLIFLIEDTNGNKFGGFVNIKIEKTTTWLTDTGMFVFSMKINGKNEMKKYMKTKNDNYGFYLVIKGHYELFEFGDGYTIQIHKKSCNNSNGSYVNKTSSYENLSSVNLFGNSGTTNFTPKRILVIQMN